MKNKRIAKLSVVALFAAVLALFAAFKNWSRPASALSVQHFSVLGAAMQPVDSTIGFDSSDGYLRTRQESTAHDVTGYIGQIDLPAKSRITRVTGYGVDDDPFFEYCFEFRRYTHDGPPVYEPFTEKVCTGERFQEGEVEISPLIYAGQGRIDNEKYSYAVYVELPAGYFPPFQDLGVLRFVVETTFEAHMPYLSRPAADDPAQ